MKKLDATQSPPTTKMGMYTRTYTSTLTKRMMKHVSWLMFHLLVKKKTKRKMASGTAIRDNRAHLLKKMVLQCLILSKGDNNASTYNTNRCQWASRSSRKWSSPHWGSAVC